MHAPRTLLLALTFACLTQVGCVHCLHRMKCSSCCASCGVPECGCPEPECCCPEPGCACPEPACCCPEPECCCPEPGCACPEPACCCPEPCVGCGSCVGCCPLKDECPILGRVGRCLRTMFGCGCCGGCSDECYMGDWCEGPCSTCNTGYGQSGSYAGGYTGRSDVQFASQPRRLSRGRVNVAQELSDGDVIGPRLR